MTFNRLRTGLHLALFFYSFHAFGGPSPVPSHTPESSKSPIPPVKAELSPSNPSSSPSSTPLPGPSHTPLPNPTPSINSNKATTSKTSSSSSSEAVRQPSSIRFDHVEEGTVFFNKPSEKTLKTVKTGLFDIKYLGFLQPKDGGLPYFVITGSPCSNCQDEKAVYLLRPNGEKPTAFVYPGKILDPKNRSLLLESRAFYGKCLPQKGDVYVVFQKEKVDRRHSLQNSVLTAEAAKDHLIEHLAERHLPNIKTTLQLTKKKDCFEVEGRNRLMLRKPLDLHPRVNDDKDDDDDDEPTKKERVDTVAGRERQPELAP